MTAIGFGLLGVGVLLVYSGVTGTSAVGIVRDALQGRSGDLTDDVLGDETPGEQYDRFEPLREARNRGGQTA